MIFRTTTGSVYEIDRQANRVRRMAGVKDPTPRQGPDGEWKTFVDCMGVYVGSQALFIWEEVEKDGVPIMKTTATSPIVEIYKEGQAS